MNIFLIRHGETNWNKEHLFQGKSNIPLNCNGIKQAEKLSNSLKEEKIDIIFSSPLDRALQTANIINKYHHAPVYIDEQISERSLGNLEGQNSANYDLAVLLEQILDLSQKENAIYQVETLHLLLNRTYQFLNTLILKYGNTDNNIYIVTHSSTLLALMLILGQLDTSKSLQQYGFENCFVYKVSNPKIRITLEEIN